MHNNDNITFYNTQISNSAKKYLNEVIDSNFISAGNVADDFEKSLSRELGLINPVSVNSGTSALHLALEAAGIGSGDEVILPAQTFIASGLSILMAGAKPVFADIQYDTGNIDPKSIEDNITKRTKAIMPVHWGGYPCDMDEINEIAKKFDLIVIEDAAHALGATYKNKVIGSISNFTAFSFQAIKHLTTGDGGALCCKSDRHYKISKNLRWFGIDRDNSKLSNLGEREYDIHDIGYKYHMNDIAAAIGIGNLEGFSNNLKRIRQISKIYIGGISNLEGLRLLNYKNDRQSAYWLFTILVERRSDFIEKMNAEKIPVSVVHQGINKYSVFDFKSIKLKNQKKFNDNQISIPIHSSLTDDHVQKIINAIKAGW